ncbi:MAG: hypothetical protein HY978_03460 [Candidatus Liptonbacteria bacterium]|nr:hypothetical protein [Candidatus Liptonbacteria bacterium]
MSKRGTVTTALFVVLIIAAFLRFYQLPGIPPGLYPDEAMNGSNALEVLTEPPPRGGFHVFYPENNGREGLFINIQALVLKYVFGVPGRLPEPWMLRVPSAIFGTLTVLGVFLLAKELFPRKITNYQLPITNKSANDQDPKFRNWKLGIRNYEVALLSAFLLATSFWHINFSRIGFRAITAPFWLTWGVWLLLISFRLMRERFQTPITKTQPCLASPCQGEERRGSDLGFGIWCLPLLAGLVYGAGFHSYIAYRTSPLLILFILAWFWYSSWREKWQGKFWLGAILFGLATVVVVSPLLVYFYQNPGTFFGRTTQVSVMSAPHPILGLAWNALLTLGMFFLVGDFNWRHNYAGQPELFAPVALFFLLGIIAGTKTLWSNIRTNSKLQALNLPPKEDPPPADKLHVPNTNNRNEAPPSLPATNKEGGTPLNLPLTRGGAEGFGFWILFLWLACAVLPVILSNESLPHALRAILMIPPTMILAGWGGVWLYDRSAVKIKPATLKGITVATLLLLTLQPYFVYFEMWAKNPEVQGSFAANYVQIAKEINRLPETAPKYVVADPGWIYVRGVPMAAQTVMFLTETFTATEQHERNTTYLLSGQEDQIPPGAAVFKIQ